MGLPTKPIALPTASHPAFPPHLKPLVTISVARGPEAFASDAYKLGLRHARRRVSAKDSLADKCLRAVSKGASRQIDSALLETGRAVARIHPSERVEGFLQGKTQL